MRIKTFVVVHNQDIILDFIKYKKFQYIDNVIYLFVGKADCSKIKDRDDVIICRELKYNLEEYKGLSSFTAWYAVWKNQLYNDSDYITFFEYDLTIKDNYYKRLQKILKNKNVDIVGYTSFNVHSYSFINGIEFGIGIPETLYKNYNIDILNYLKTFSFDKKCSLVLNKTLKKEIFENYMKWCIPIVNDFKTSPIGGHLMERIITCYYLLHNLNHKFLLHGLYNISLDSVGNQEIEKSKYGEFYDLMVGKKYHILTKEQILNKYGVKVNHKIKIENKNNQTHIDYTLGKDYNYNFIEIKSFGNEFELLSKILSKKIKYVYCETFIKDFKENEINIDQLDDLLYEYGMIRLETFVDYDDNVKRLFYIKSSLIKDCRFFEF